MTPPPDPDPDDDLDGDTYLPPLPPEDRLWRHPSELAAERAAEAVLRSGPPVSALLVGAMIVVTLLGGLLALAATRDDPSPTAQRSWLGVRVVGIAENQDAEGPEHGVLVVEVLAGSPAEGSGIAAGDVITGVDSHDVDSTEELIAELGGRQTGDRVRIALWRDARHRHVWVELAAHPD